MRTKSESNLKLLSIVAIIAVLAKFPDSECGISGRLLPAPDR